MSTEDSNDFTDQEVAAVLSAGMSSTMYNTGRTPNSCTSALSAHTGYSPYRSSTVMTNISRGNITFSAQPDQQGECSVHQLAAKGELNALRQILSIDNIDSIDEYGRTPLIAAAQSGWADVVRMLVRCGADADVADTQGATALIHTCSAGFTQCARLLLHGCADVNMASNTGNTALHYAVFGDHRDCVRLLLKWGGDMTAENEDGLTPVSLATDMEHREVRAIFNQHLLSLLNDSIKT